MGTEAAEKAAGPSRGRESSRSAPCQSRRKLFPPSIAEGCRLPHSSRTLRSSSTVPGLPLPSRKDAASLSPPSPSSSSSRTPPSMEFRRAGVAPLSPLRLSPPSPSSSSSRTSRSVELRHAGVAPLSPWRLSPPSPISSSLRTPLSVEQQGVRFGATGLSATRAAPRRRRVLPSLPRPRPLVN
jgi:hypothetical protein